MTTSCKGYRVEVYLAHSEGIVSKGFVVGKTVGEVHGETNMYEITESNCLSLAQAYARKARKHGLEFQEDNDKVWHWPAHMIRRIEVIPIEDIRGGDRN
jgi:hypothetical protein